MQALDGIRVIEFSRMPITSFVAMLLGDFGAEVIKVDSPQVIANTGGSVPPPGKDKDEIRRGAYYQLNRNKKSVAVDLKSEAGKKIFLELAGKADILLEGFRPGVMKRLGVDYETVSKLNPGIIYCSISGYGQDGPYKDLPGHDINYISFAGLLGLIGKPGDKPVIPLNLFGDYAGGSLHAAIGILLALEARRRIGRGQYVDISMTDGVISLLTGVTQDYFTGGSIPGRGEGPLDGGYPYYDVYETSDGKYITIGCLEDWFWENLCRELGREDLIPYGFRLDQRYHRPEGEEWQKISTFLEETFRTKTRDEWFELLSKKNIAVGKVYHPGEVFADPQVKHRQMLLEMNHPDVGKVKHTGIAIKLSDTPGEVRSLSPLLGEHTDEILSGLGYTRKQIQNLRQGEVIR